MVDRCRCSSENAERPCGARVAVDAWSKVALGHGERGRGAGPIVLGEKEGQHRGAAASLSVNHAVPLAIPRMMKAWSTAWGVDHFGTGGENRLGGAIGALGRQRAHQRGTLAPGKVTMMLVEAGINIDFWACPCRRARGGGRGWPPRPELRCKRGAAAVDLQGGPPRRHGPARPTPSRAHRWW